MDNSGKMTIPRAMVAAVLGLLLGTGLFVVVLTVAASIQGMAVADFFASLGRGVRPGFQGDEAVITLKASIFILYVLVCSVLAGALMRRSGTLLTSATVEPRDNFFEDSVENGIDALRAELRGRVSASVGFILGELSTDKVKSEPTDLHRINEAIEYSRKAYWELRRVGGNAKVLALNNLVYYSAVRRLPEDAPFILKKARELREYGEEHNAPNLLLTYCRAVIAYAYEKSERSEARNILSVLAQSSDAEWTVREEAKLSLASMTPELRGIYGE